MLIDRRAGGLQQIDVMAADGLMNLDLRLAVGKAPALVARWLRLQESANRGTQWAAGWSGEDGNLMLHGRLDALLDDALPTPTPAVDRGIRQLEDWQFGCFL
jgi:hypothetical protein